MAVRPVRGAGKAEDPTPAASARLVEAGRVQTGNLLPLPRGGCRRGLHAFKVGRGLEGLPVLFWLLEGSEHSGGWWWVMQGSRGPA